jgi:flagellar basal body-associated protein FliL
MQEHEMSDAPGSTEAGLGAAKGGARSGAVNLITIIVGAVAVLAIAFGAFMFMQANAAKHKLAQAEMPDGLKEEADPHAEQHGEEGVSADPMEAVYELGDFTANSADGKFVKMKLALVVKSFYRLDDWSNYQLEMDQYNDQRQAYYDFMKSTVEGEEKGKKKKEGGHAALPPATQVAILLSGSTPVAASEGGKAPEPPALPEAPPVRPLTRLEAKFKEDDARVRNIIITEINAHSAADMISTEGKADFKKKVMDNLNSSFDRAYGEVVDIYFRELVTT